MAKSKRSKSCDISQQVRQTVYERDGGICIVCKMRQGAPNMHYKRRSQGGLGIEQNVVCGCDKCHHDFDNGNRREEIEKIVREYLQSYYGEEWNEQGLIYQDSNYSWCKFSK